MVFSSSDESENDVLEFSRDVRILRHICLLTTAKENAILDDESIYKFTPLQVAQSEVVAELDLFSEIKKERKFSYAAELHCYVSYQHNAAASSNSDRQRSRQYQRQRNIIPRLANLKVAKGKFSSNYFRGTLYGEMRVTLQKVKRENNIKEISTKLNSPNFLAHHFEFKSTNSNTYYFMKDSFSFTVHELLYNPEYREKQDKLHIRDLFRDVSSALKFAKTAGMYNLNIRLQTIALTELNSAPNMYKIMDLSFAKSTIKSVDFKKDVAAFGNILVQLRMACQKNQNLVPAVNWSLTDDILLLDVMSRMILKEKLTNSLKTLDQLPTIEEISEHVFIWTTEQKVAAFIRSVKVLESLNKETFMEILEHGRDVVPVPENWTTYLENDVLEELNRILHETTKNTGTEIKDGIFSLVKTIRNMLVHAPNSEVIAKKIGVTDNEIIQYWSKKFPKILLHIFLSLEDFDNHQRAIENVLRDSHESDDSDNSEYVAYGTAYGF